MSRNPLMVSADGYDFTVRNTNDVFALNLSRTSDDEMYGFVFEVRGDEPLAYSVRIKKK